MAPDFTLDFDRMRRVGFPEVVLAQGKTPLQIVEICRQLARAHDVLVTRLSPEQWEEVSAAPLPGRASYDARSMTLRLTVGKPMRQLEGSVAVVTAGTADTAVAEEARATLEYLGVSSTLVPDVGVAGVLRLLSRVEEIEKADIIIAVAGMEGSLFSVLGGLVGKPVIAIPTSSGYGASLQGFAALLSAMTSCANGVLAVNIDSGDAAGHRGSHRGQHGGRRRLDGRHHLPGLLPGPRRAPLPRQRRRGRQGAARPLHRPAL